MDGSAQLRLRAARVKPALALPLAAVFRGLTQIEPLFWRQASDPNSFCPFRLVMDRERASEISANCSLVRGCFLANLDARRLHQSSQNMLMAPLAIVCQVAWSLEKRRSESRLFVVLLLLVAARLGCARSRSSIMAVQMKVPSEKARRDAERWIGWEGDQKALLTGSSVAASGRSAP